MHSDGSAWVEHQGRDGPLGGGHVERAAGNARPRLTVHHRRQRRGKIVAQGALVDVLYHGHLGAVDEQVHLCHEAVQQGPAVPHVIGVPGGRTAIDVIAQLVSRDQDGGFPRCKQHDGAKEPRRTVRAELLYHRGLCLTTDVASDAAHVHIRVDTVAVHIFEAAYRRHHGG